MSSTGQQEVCIIGGTSVDTIIHLDRFPAPKPQTVMANNSYRALGSTGAGKALTLKALGLNPTLHTALGPDPEADFVAHRLRALGISALIDHTDAPTEQHVNLMTPDGQRLSIFAQPPPSQVRITWGPLQSALQACDIAVVNILDYARPVLELVRRLGKPIWTDLHDYDGHNPYHQAFLEAAEVIFLSSDNLPEYRDFMQRAVAQGKRFVVCTHGAAGASLLDAEGNWIEQQPFPVATLVDSNGAGDAFFSGFLYGYLNGYSLERCMALAAAAGALCVMSDQLAPADLSAEALLRLVDA